MCRGGVVPPSRIGDEPLRQLTGYTVNMENHDQAFARAAPLGRMRGRGESEGKFTESRRKLIRLPDHGFVSEKIEYTSVSSTSVGGYSFPEEWAGNRVTHPPTYGSQLISLTAREPYKDRTPGSVTPA